MKNIIFISGICGCGKSSICEYIKNNNLFDNYNIYDIDELENVNDYNEDDYNLFYLNSINKAISKSKDKDIIIFSCINHNDLNSIKIDGVSFKILLITCSKDEITKRLKERDKSRNCSDDTFINEQLKYQDWFISNMDYYDGNFDNTSISLKEISENIVEFIKLNF